jgi:outer membrane protein OmpA-like peptidoglycan-associated protein
MKKIFLLAVLLIAGFFMQGQVLKKIADRAKNRTETNVNNKVDNAVDKTVDDAMNPNIIRDKITDTTKKEEGSAAIKSENTPAGFKAYSKYDFVPGEKIIGFEDFSTGSIGDFPAGWNTTGAAEIVTVEGKPGRWLMLTKPGVFVPEFTENYPEDFTLELDVLHGLPFAGASFKMVLAQLDNVSQPQNWTLGPNNIAFEFYTPSSKESPTNGSSSYSNRKNSTSDAANQIGSDLFSDQTSPAHISIWRQKERIRLYANQEKIWDIPKGISKDAKFNAIVIYVLHADATVPIYFGNFRLAIGAPDTRNKFVTQNKWVTHGILFDVNSATIKPESYGTIKEMANVLKEYADLKVKIIGHTDADGKDPDNLDLSKRRAASVKESLAKEFGIDESRMETDGKGEGEPIDKNDNPAGKANNRRVEFIKL